MSRSRPEWVASHDDQNIPPRVKLRLFEAAYGRCQECSRKLMAGDHPQYDHRVALINGGQHRETNIQVLCETCHSTKTKADVHEKSVVYTKRLKHLGLKKKRSGFKRWRRFDGSVVIAPKDR